MIRQRDIGLYVHIPFCRTRCHFCAFYLELYRPETAESFVSSLLREVELYAIGDPLNGRSLVSIYFGGGTPTMLRPDQLCRILIALRRVFPLRHDAEISIEAHPDNISLEELSILREAGFNRLSVGIESTSASELVRVGRPTSSSAGEQAVAAARQAGFTNISLDLMYGLPGQTTASWRHTLDCVISWNPTHLSCYALTVEEGTRLHADVLRGTQPTPDPDFQNELEQVAEDCLRHAGYERYEISNYAQPGFASRHNLLYWTDEDYLGLGPSAQSYVNGWRFGNIDDLTSYRERLARGELPIQERERLTPDQQQREAMIFGLRLVRGIPGELYQQAEWAVRLRPFLDEKMLELTATGLRLTSHGRRYADSIAVALL